MSTVLDQPMSPEQFLAWEERQELRYEFDGVAVRAMTGGSMAHAMIQANLVGTLHSGLRGTPWRVFGRELKVETAHGYRYPDALVTCGPIAMTARAITDPVVIFEVVGPGSVAVDFNIKNAEYRTLPSLRRYVVLQQSTAAAAVFTRHGDRWENELVAGPDAVLPLPEIGVSLPLAEIYRDIAFASEPDAPA